MRGQSKTIPAPIGGWNARDSVDQMPEDHAILLDNFFPQEGKLTLRKGYTSYATGMTSNVETLAEFHSGSTRKFIAAANGNIWDISSSGAASSLASGLTNNRWQWVNFNGAMGLVNGQDAPKTYDGSTVSNMTVSGSGLTVANLVGVNVFKSRTYFWENNSQDFWYSAVNALGGALTKFPLSRVGRFGGNLVTMGTWTRDGGDGMDDLAVFVMSSGECVVYQGSDPGSSTDWSLVGVYKIGAPVSIRSAYKVGGDLILITKDGYQSLSNILGKARQGDLSISDQINDAARLAVQEFGDNYGWQAILYPRGNMMIFNVPASTNTTYYQHVFNTRTGAPCRFKNINARCWGIYNERIYFGGNGVVYLFDDGLNDNGAAITGDCIQSPNYFGSRGNAKQVTSFQPVLSSDGPISYAYSIGTDFNQPVTPASLSDYSATGATWDDADWDTAEWSGGDRIYKSWRSVNAYGYNFLLRLKVQVSAQTCNWYSTNYIFKKGGLI